MAAPYKTVVLAVVTITDELSLSCTTSLLKLQQVAALRGDIKLDVHIVHSFLEALNAFTTGDYIVVMDGNTGVSPEFVFGILETKHLAIAGVYPLPRVDWERVTKVLNDPNATEPLNHAGNVYNVVPVPGQSLGRYVPIKDVTELKVLALDCSVLKKMAGPDISYDGGKGFLFAHESVYEDMYQNAYQTFARKLGVEIVADLEAPCTLAAPAQFAGVIGMRTTVR